MTKAFCQYSIQVYAPDAVMETPNLAPIQCINVAGLPPALIITAEFDPLRYKGYAYAERLKQAGVPVQYRCFTGQIHCLLSLPPEATELRELDQLITATTHKTLRRK